MKILSKKNILIIVLSCDLFLASSVQAKSLPVQNNVFCRNISTSAKTTLDQLGVKKTNLLKQQNKAAQQLLDDRKNINKKTLQDRLLWDQNLSKNLDQLLAKAKNSAEQNAVTNFKQSLMGAIFNRRLEIDSALKDFRQKTDTLKNSNNSSSMTNLDKFISDTKAAFDEADASCQNSIKQKNARGILKIELQKARNNFLKSQNSLPTNSSIASIIKEYNQKKSDSLQNFEKIVEDAEQTLRNNTSLNFDY